MTYAIVFVVVTENRKSSVLSELRRLCNDGIVNGLQHYHCRGVARTNLQQNSVYCPYSMNTGAAVGNKSEATKTGVSLETAAKCFYVHM